jgi:hypothetical protein
MRVGVDIDDVLYPLYDGMHRASEVAGITNGVTPTSWDPYKDYGCTLEDWIGALSAPTLDGTLYQGDPYPGAVEALERIKAAGHTIHLVTARGLLQHGEFIKAHTYRWVAEHLAHVVDSLTFSKDKTVVPVATFLDDNVGNYQRLVEHGVPAYLLDQPWNKDAGDDTVFRVGSVDEFADLIIAGKVEDPWA